LYHCSRCRWQDRQLQPKNHRIWNIPTTVMAQKSGFQQVLPFIAERLARPADLYEVVEQGETDPTHRVSGMQQSKKHLGN
jgi:hypothetical protein